MKILPVPLTRQNFFLILALIFGLFFLIENLNGRFALNDFRVYYDAAQSFLRGEPVYGQTFGLSTGHYKYSPAAFFLFIPFSLVSFSLAKIIFFGINCVAVVVTLLLGGKVIARYLLPRTGEKSPYAKLLLCALIISPHIYRELHLGNVNLILLLMMLVTFQALAAGRTWTAGLLFAGGVLIKPFFLVLIPLFLLRGKFKMLLASGIGLAMGIALPALLVGVKENIMLHKSWIGAMAAHNLSLSNSPDTIYAWVAKILPLGPSVEQGTAFVIGTLLLLAAVLLILVLHHLSSERQITADNGRERIALADFGIEYFVILALIPNLVVTDTEHFLLSLPVLILIWDYLLYFRKGERLLVSLVLVACLLYGGNWHDALGDSLSRWMGQSGILGLGNLLLIFIGVWIWERGRKGLQVPIRQ